MPETADLCFHSRLRTFAYEGERASTQCAPRWRLPGVDADRNDLSHPAESAKGREPASIILISTDIQAMGAWPDRRFRGGRNAASVLVQAGIAHL
jgi:hypothetical protein